MYKYS